MKAAIALTIVLSLGCVSASPTFGSLVAGKSIAASASSSSSSYSASSSSGFNYYSSDVCTAVGFTLRDDLPTCIFDDLEQQFLQKKCELLNSYGVYPCDIGPNFCNLQPDSLYYDIILIGSGPAGLSALSTLAALGKRILVVDKGHFAPACADSLYYRGSLYASDYVNTFPGYINGEITKNLYTSNVLGGLSVLDTNCWNIGSKCLYDQLAHINDEFAWDKIYNYYKSLECYKSYSREVKVTSTSSSSSSSSSSYDSSCLGGSSSVASSSSQQTSTTTTTYEYSTSGSYSIYNSYKESFLTRTLSSVFDELGYSNCNSPFDLLPNRYSILPILGDQERPTLFPNYIFKSLEQYKHNIDLALRTTASQIIFNGKRASGIQVLTPSGQQVTLYANDQVILSTGPISTYQLLFNSGCGPQDLLNKYNIPVNFHIPSMGNGLCLPPVHHGLCLKFPKGYLNDCDSDLRNLAYAFGDYEMSPSLSLNYYRAYLAVKGASEANVALKFYAFSQSTSIRLKTMMGSYFQYDSYTQEYVSSLLNEYDIMIVGTHLLAPKSRGLITYKDCIDKPYIDLGMYSDNYDVECMMEAIEHVRALAQTKAFLNLNCECVQFPIQNCNGDFFTPDFNKQSILYHSIPSLYGSGAFPLGNDYQTAVVDKALRVLGTENLRLFSPCVSPYPLYSDSLAFSTFIGSYGSKIICDEYNGQIFPFIPCNDINGGGISINHESSSYASRDIDVSSSYSSTDINGISGLGGSSVYQSSSSSSDVSSNYENSSSTCIDNGLGIGGSSISSSSSKSSSNYEANESSSSSVIGADGYCSNQSSSNSSSNFEANESSSNTVIGAGGVVAQQSSSSYDAQNSSSNVSSSSYSDGLGGVQASNYEASSQSSSVNAQQQSSSYIAGGVGVPC